MEIYLLKFFHFRQHETVPYRIDGRGGNIFHGVGSHILYSDLRHRWYRFAYEVATVDQPPDVHLLASRLSFTVHGVNGQPQQSELKWRNDCKRSTKDPTLNSYQWTQHAEIDIVRPVIVTVHVDFQFSNAPDWLPIDGVGRVLVDLHPNKPPKVYNYPIWHVRRWLSTKSQE